MGCRPQTITLEYVWTLLVNLCRDMLGNSISTRRPRGWSAKFLNGILREEGVRCIITSRAKSFSRLEDKCRQRDTDKEYTSVEQIYDDIVDLAGARVALYFPEQRDRVGNRIHSLFNVLRVKRFPENSTKQEGRSSAGYSATHYHVRLREDTLKDPDKRHANTRVEIQVASVLMHAWAEVDHDLVYKPQNGVLSAEEYAVLDHLNGLVTLGEEMLKRLQQAGEERTAESNRQFSNHYELATYLLSRPEAASEKPVSDSGLGRVDWLFEFLRELNIVTPSKLSPYLDALHGNLELRPLSEQVVDALMVEDSSRYAVYQNLQLRKQVVDKESDLLNAPIVRFLQSWINLEQIERDLRPSDIRERRIFPAGRRLEQLGLLDGDKRRELDFLRRMRNDLVHRLKIPSAATLNEAADELDAIVAEALRRDGSNPDNPSSSL